MKLKIELELTPNLIEVLNTNQLKEVIYQLLAIQPAQVENKLSIDSIISNQIDNGLNALKIDQFSEDNVKIEEIQPNDTLNSQYDKLKTEVKNNVDSRIEKVKKELSGDKNNEIVKQWNNDNPNFQVNTLHKSNEFIKSKKGELIPMSEIADLYKNGISIQRLCHKYDMNYTTIYNRLEKLNLIIKKKSVKIKEI